MMKKILILISFFLVNTAWAYSSEPIVFWYPGEAGSTAEAQPILDEFTDYINSKIPKADLTARYFNTNEEGLNYIKSKKPNIAIISYFAWEKYKTQFPGASVWLATNPLPAGSKSESYTLVGKPGSKSKTLAAYSSEPLTKEFISGNLGFAGNITPTQTSQILYTLRQISSGKIDGFAILTPTEADVFKRMKAPWVKTLTVLAVSKPVPTARVILFGETTSKTNDLKKVFLGIKNDPSAKDILTELRLVGFSNP